MERTTTLGAAAVIGLLALGACGTQAAQSADSGGGGAETRGSAPQVVHARAADQAFGTTVGTKLSSNSVLDRLDRRPASPLVAKRSLIHTGQVMLRSGDVAAAASGVRAVARKYAGRIDDEQALARRGRLTEDTLTVRVPSRHFTAALDAIKGLGTLRSATSSADDVSTQVIDVGVRLRAERSSLHRIEQLMQRAQTLGQVIALEGQLTERQASLNGLEQKQAYLRDQTSMSTITVDVSRTRTPPAATGTAAKHRTGFIGGLRHGWHALVVSATAVAAGVGAALPFGVPLLVLGVPAWLLVRRLRRRRPTPAADPAA